MELKETILSHYNIYKEKYKSDLDDLRSKLEDMAISLREDLDKDIAYLQKMENECETIHYPKLIKVLFKLFVDPITHEHKSARIYFASSWSAFISPYHHNPIFNFEVFFERVTSYCFYRTEVYGLTVDYEFLIEELRSFYYSYMFKRSFINEDINDLIENSENYNSYKSLLTESPLVNRVILAINENQNQNSVDMEKNLPKLIYFDAMVESFLKSVSNIDKDFKTPEVCYKILYDDLKSQNLINIKYSEFRILLIIETSQLINFKWQNKIIISLDGTNCQLKDIGVIFKNLSVSYYKGNKLNFYEWIRNNFDIYKSDGNKAAMTDSSFRKIIK